MLVKDFNILLREFLETEIEENNFLNLQTSFLDLLDKADPITINLQKLIIFNQFYQIYPTFGNTRVQVFQRRNTQTNETNQRSEIIKDLSPIFKSNSINVKIPSIKPSVNENKYPMYISSGIPIHKLNMSYSTQMEMTPPHSILTHNKPLKL